MCVIGRARENLWRCADSSAPDADFVNSFPGVLKMEDFATTEIQTDATSIFVRWGAKGAPLLLLHGFPQTHLMWRKVAPILTREFTIVCADLRGYGRSGCPPSTVDHSPYSKRAMAHFSPEELPEQTAQALRRFFSTTAMDFPAASSSMG